MPTGLTGTMPGNDVEITLVYAPDNWNVSGSRLTGGGNTSGGTTTIPDTQTPP